MNYFSQLDAYPSVTNLKQTCPTSIFAFRSDEDRRHWKDYVRIVNKAWTLNWIKPRLFLQSNIKSSSLPWCLIKDINWSVMNDVAVSKTWIKIHLIHTRQLNCTERLPTNQKINEKNYSRILFDVQKKKFRVWVKKKKIFRGRSRISI